MRAISWVIVILSFFCNTGLAKEPSGCEIELTSIQSDTSEGVSRLFSAYFEVIALLKNELGYLNQEDLKNLSENPSPTNILADSQGEFAPKLGFDEAILFPFYERLSRIIEMLQSSSNQDELSRESIALGLRLRSMLAESEEMSAQSEIDRVYTRKLLEPILAKTYRLEIKVTGIHISGSISAGGDYDTIPHSTDRFHSKRNYFFGVKSDESTDFDKHESFYGSFEDPDKLVRLPIKGSIIENYGTLIFQYKGVDYMYTVLFEERYGFRPYLINLETGERVYKRFSKKMPVLGNTLMEINGMPVIIGQYVDGYEKFPNSLATFSLFKDTRRLKDHSDEVIEKILNDHPELKKIQERFINPSFDIFSPSSPEIDSDDIYLHVKLDILSKRSSRIEKRLHFILRISRTTGKISGDSRIIENFDRFESYKIIQKDGELYLILFRSSKDDGYSFETINLETLETQEGEIGNLHSPESLFYKKDGEDRFLVLANRGSRSGTNSVISIEEWSPFEDADLNSIAPKEEPAAFNLIQIKGESFVVYLGVNSIEYVNLRDSTPAFQLDTQHEFRIVSGALHMNDRIYMVAIEPDMRVMSLIQVYGDMPEKP